MSLVNVNAIEPSTGTDITLGASGDTLTVPSGATLTVSGTMNASSITAGTVATARLGSGTADATTFLRGDQTYASAGGDNTPAFLAYQGSDQTSLASGSTTKIEYGTEIFDTDSTYDHSTNYRWTPAVVGKYAIGCSGAMSVNTGERIALMVYKNGSSVLRAQSGYSGANGDQFSIAGVIDVTSTSDYFEGYIYNGSSGAKGLSGGESICRFWGYKLIT